MKRSEMSILLKPVRSDAQLLITFLVEGHEPWTVFH